MADTPASTDLHSDAPSAVSVSEIVSSDNYEQLREIASGYLDSSDLEKIDAAYRFARDHHKGQKRKSGEPYICHPVEVAIILAKNLHSDLDTLCAGLLHDTVEDTDVTIEDIEEQFGGQVAELVDGVTKLTNISVSSLSEQQALNLRKMFLAMAKDIRVIIIKLADRLHNMRTLMAIPEDRRIFKATETMEIYAQLANRLGISSIKWELEDLSFYYLNPVKYHQIERMVADSRAEREAYLNKVISILSSELEQVNISGFRILGRPKHFYSIYKKMNDKGKDFDEIYDLSALRVITKTLRDCYGSLGAVHSLWTPMPGRFKDYIAMPKYNMYQSLHTTVIGPSGRPLEVQIRTEEMNRSAEYGVAAHWLYKQSGSSEAKKDSQSQHLDDQLSWIGRTLDWTQQDDLSDPKEFLEAVKLDLYGGDVFVFTPRGEVQILRAGSTPIDFAYAVHTEVGHHCIGAKVNGSVVPLSYTLQMGDRVEIITQNNARPSRDWLALAKTPSARQKIRAYLNRITKADDSATGREMLAKEMRKIGLGISTPRTVRALNKVAPEFGVSSADDLFVLICNGKASGRSIAAKVKSMLDGVGDSQAEAERRALESLSTSAAAPRLSRSTQNSIERKKRASSNFGVFVEGGEGLLVRLAHCCNPVMGDDIVGFITRGRGVSVHRSDCPNVEALKKNEGRMIEVSWDSGQNATYQVEIVVEAIDRTRLLGDTSTLISDAGANILSSGTRTTRTGITNMRFLIELSDVKGLDPLLARIQSLEGILEARRALPGENTSKHSS